MVGYYCNIYLFYSPTPLKWSKKYKTKKKMKAVLERSLTTLIVKTIKTRQDSVNQLRIHWEEGGARIKTSSLP